MHSREKAIKDLPVLFFFFVSPFLPILSTLSLTLTHSHTHTHSLSLPIASAEDNWLTHVNIRKPYRFMYEKTLDKIESKYRYCVVAFNSQCLWPESLRSIVRYPIC